jgi:hypothetical protein
VSIEKSFDLQFSATDAGRFVPVYLSKPNSPIRELHLGKALSLSPTTVAIELSKASNFTNAGPSGESLYVRDLTYEVDVHALRRSNRLDGSWLPSND